MKMMGTKNKNKKFEWENRMMKNMTKINKIK